MGLEGILRRIREHRGTGKTALDKYLDPALFTLGSNAAYLWAADKALDAVSQNVDSNEGLAMFGTYAALSVGIAAANKYFILPTAKRIRDRHESRKRIPVGIGSWVRTIVQTSALTGLYLVSNFQVALSNFEYDAKRVINAFGREQTQIEERVEEDRHLDEAPTVLARLIPSDLDLESVKDSNKYSTKGMFLRAYRWDKVFRKIGKEEGVPDDILAALAMRESYGNPLELNSGADGGAGLMMFQPGTARAFGLKIYGNSRASGRDRNHGVKLRELVRRHGWDYERLRRADERFDVYQSTRAAAKYLKREFNRHGSWDEALSAYNRGTPARNPRATEHVRAIRNYRQYYREHRDDRRKS